MPKSSRIKAEAVWISAGPNARNYKVYPTRPDPDPDEALEVPPLGLLCRQQIGNDRVAWRYHPNDQRKSFIPWDTAETACAHFGVDLVAIHEDAADREPSRLDNLVNLSAERKRRHSDCSVDRFGVDVALCVVDACLEAVGQAVAMGTPEMAGLRVDTFQRLARAKAELRAATENLAELERLGWIEKGKIG